MTQQEDQSKAEQSVLSSARVLGVSRKSGRPLFDVESQDGAFIHC